MSAIKSRRKVLNNRTTLTVFRSEVAGAEIVSEEVTTSKSNLNSDGVEVGEDQEHHLAAALSAAALRAQQSNLPSSRHHSTSTNTTNNNHSPKQSTSSASVSKPLPIPESAFFIPTPDAAGQVDALKYASLYPSGAWEDPHSYVRFSETVEETSSGNFGLGYIYTMNETDSDWLDSNNKLARGEGPSSAVSGGTPNERGSRKGKDKQKENDDIVVPVLSEDDFELCMALMEKYTEERVPFLHMDLSRMPPFSDMEYLFSHTPQPNTFPNYKVPESIPPPGTLVRMGRAIYPHWKERRTEAGGKSIIPQLNYDETNDGDPYVCFRRRDVKPVRKTRRTDSQSVDRLVQLYTELVRAAALAHDTVQRESKKNEVAELEMKTWEVKMGIINIRRKHPTIGLQPQEEEMLFKTGVGSVKRQRQELPHIQSTARIVGAAGDDRDRFNNKHRPSKRDDGMSPAPDFERRREQEGRHAPVEALREKMTLIAQQIERDIARKKDWDFGWEDQTDACYQPTPSSLPLRFFRPLSDSTTHLQLLQQQQHQSNLSLQSQQQQPLRHRAVPTTTSVLHSRPTTFRMRRGRGGIIRVDRRFAPHSRELPPKLSNMDLISRGRGKDPEFYPSTIFQDEYSRLPPTLSALKRKADAMEDASEESEAMEGVIEEGDVEMKKKEDAEYGKKISERWRYDDDAGALGVGMGMRGVEDEDRLIIDDFSSRYVKNRLNLLDEADLTTLQTDLTHLHTVQRAAEEPPERPPPVVLSRPVMPMVTRPPGPQQQQPVRINNGGQPPVPGQIPVGLPHGQPMVPMPHQLPMAASGQSQQQMRGAPSNMPSQQQQQQRRVPNGVPMSGQSMPSGQQMPNGSRASQGMVNGVPQAGSPVGRDGNFAMQQQGGNPQRQYSAAQMQALKNNLQAQQMRNHMMAQAGVGGVPQPGMESNTSFHSAAIPNQPMKLNLPPGRNGQQFRGQATQGLAREGSNGSPVMHNGNIRTPTPLPPHISPTPSHLSPRQQAQQIAG